MAQRTSAPVAPAVGRHGLLRDLNYRAVLERLASAGPASRTDLVGALGLSAASVGRVVDGLLRVDLVREGARVTTGVGRPQTLLHVNERASLVAGASVRSRYMRLHLADLEGNVLGRVQVERTREGAAALALQLADLVTRERAAHAPDVRLAAVVVGVPGVWDEAGQRVFGAPHLADLEGVDFRRLLLEALAGRVLGDTVMVDNDANLAAVGEQEHGAARGVADFFYLGLGSGVGGAAVVAGSLHRGPHGFAGEIGYLPVWSDGRIARLEDVVGRGAIERIAQKAGLVVTGDVFDYLGSHASHDDPIADHLVDVLGQALVAVVTTLDPSLIVLGGGLGRYGSLWAERIHQRLASFVPVVPRVVSTAIGRDASLLGAVALGRTAARDVLLQYELGV
ncbi:MAG: ROK family protein [Trueperaceae bacterium]